jgi:AraC-like DNA-binding protein/quercetin dioxygenase-like cupin family protein
MLRSGHRVVWEDAYAVIEPQITASAVHVWHFEESFPVDVRHFILRREADIRLNRHDYFELLYLHSGEVTYEVAGERHPMKPGDLFVMSGRPHRMSDYGRAQIRAITLYFLPDFIRAHDPTGDDVQYLMPFLVQDTNFPHVVPAKSGVPAQVRDLMGRIHAELPSQSARSRLMVRTYVKMILALLVNHYAQFRDSAHVLTQRQRDLDRLRAAFDLIEARYADKITVSDVADEVHMSKSHFMRFFKQVTGQPFISHLNQFRIAKAQHLLASTNRSIAEIGHDVGFCNQSYFGLVFHKVTHLSPREYQTGIAEDIRKAGEDDSPELRAKAG